MKVLSAGGKICIVGGGTSAWLTATYLSRGLDNDIIVIDSELDSSVAVGEATLPGFIRFWDDCGFVIMIYFIESVLLLKPVYYLQIGRKKIEIYGIHLWEPLMIYGLQIL